MPEAGQWYSLRSSDLRFQDLLTYELLSISPFEIAECTIGTGVACGSVFLDQMFLQFLRPRLGRQLAETILPRVIKYFQNELKPVFNPYSPDCKEEYDIPLLGCPDFPELRLEDGYLKIRKLLMRN
jgi:hypothetical protein